MLVHYQLLLWLIPAAVCQLTEIVATRGIELTDSAIYVAKRAKKHMEIL